MWIEINPAVFIFILEILIFPFLWKIYHAHLLTCLGRALSQIVYYLSSIYFINEGRRKRF